MTWLFIGCRRLASNLSLKWKTCQGDNVQKAYEPGFSVRTSMHACAGVLKSFDSRIEAVLTCILVDDVPNAGQQCKMLCVLLESERKKTTRLLNVLGSSLLCGVLRLRWLHAITISTGPLDLSLHSLRQVGSSEELVSRLDLQTRPRISAIRYRMPTCSLRVS